MTLSDFSIKRPVFSWILMFGLIFFGCIAFRQMGINENPDVEYPTVRINYYYDGAAPEVIDKDVVEPAESVLVAMEGIRNISSKSDRGTARITLEFDLNKDIDFALQEVNTLLSRAQRLLPDSLDPPVVTKSNAADRPIMYLALSAGSLSQRELMILFRDQVKDRLSTVDGIAEVRPFGYHEPILRVELDAQKLKEYQLTPSDIVRSIDSQHGELPAGRFESEDQEDLIRILGEAESPEEFRDMIISRRGGSPNFKPIKLRDIAKVERGVENLRRISRINGVQALGMAIQKQRGVNAVATADLLHKRIAEINKTLPDGTSLSVNFDRTQFIRDSVDELIFTLILSIILTSLVCWLFIGSWSAAVNILLAIPTAIIGTFIFIQPMGFTLNTFSLLGLALAIGIIVDDAIVMLENIIRYQQNGHNRINAAFKGAREVTFAVLATTLALVAIFIPITFMPGLEGRFFFEFAVTISIAVALSSVEALTLAPMRCSQFLSVGPRTSLLGKGVDSSILGFRKLYKNILEFSLRNRLLVISASMGLFAGSLGILKYLSTELVPPQDRGVLFLVFQAPQGKSLSYTKKKVAEFEKIALEHSGVARIFTAVGGFGRGGQGNKGNGVVILKERKQRKGQSAIAAELRKQAKALKGVRVFIRDRFGNPLAGRRGSPIEFTINGPNLATRQQLFEKFKERMDQDPSIVGTRSEDVDSLPEIHLIPDRRAAKKRGVEIKEINSAVNIALGGVVATQYTEGGRRFDVFVQLEDEDRDTPKDLQNILVRNNRGQLISLADVVSPVPEQGPQVVFREDRVQGLRVDSSLGPNAKSGDIIKKINAWAKEILPEEYYIKFSATPQDKLLSASLIMLLGLIFAYMVLASQFNSFVDPILVFLAIPFGVTGSLFALYLGGQSVNLYSIIGMLLTMGIVKKNSILLVEFTNQLRDQGKSISEALRDACDIRLRPILMTNAATLAAAIPPALALGPGSETRVPMALTVIGGVIVSMAFTLVVVPCVYSLVKPKRIRIEETEA